MRDDSSLQLGNGRDDDINKNGIKDNFTLQFFLQVPSSWIPGRGLWSLFLLASKP